MRVVDFVAASCGAFLLVASVAQASATGALSFNGVTCVDYSNLGPSAPKYEIGSRVVDLLNGLHFDDIMIDTPNGMRPPSVVYFFRSQNAECARAAKSLDSRNLWKGRPCLRRPDSRHSNTIWISYPSALGISLLLRWIWKRGGASNRVPRWCLCPV